MSDAMTKEQQFEAGACCETCRFFDGSTYRGEDQALSPCKAHAPIAHTTANHAAVWPWVEAGDWCGDWEAGT